MAAETSPTPYVCDLPGWGADGSAVAAQEAAIDTATTVNAAGRDPEKLATAVAFATEGWPQESPDTPHKGRPDMKFYREVYGNGKLELGRHGAAPLGLRGRDARRQPALAADPRLRGADRPRRAQVHQGPAHHPPPRHRAGRAQRRRGHTSFDVSTRTRTSGARPRRGRTSTTAT